MTDDRQRLDVALEARGLVASRSRARDLIKRGLVRVDGVVEHRPARMVWRADVLQCDAGEAGFVSRGAVKLTAALKHFSFSPRDQIALDLGASTGGFCQVLLDGGARRVYAVDVGQSQLHDQLKADKRVVNLERTDARSLDVQLVCEPVGAIVADVSFISLIKILPAAMRLAAPGAWMVCLVKPQFEVGPEVVGKGGIVRSTEMRERALGDVRAWIERQAGWQVSGAIPSPIAGAGGNKEFLLGATYAM